MVWTNGADTNSGASSLIRDDRARELRVFCHDPSLTALPANWNCDTRKYGSYRLVPGSLQFGSPTSTGQILRWHVSCTDIETGSGSRNDLQQENVCPFSRRNRQGVDGSRRSWEPLPRCKRLLLAHLEGCATTDSTVLITGETVNGAKSWSALDAIHRRSSRPRAHSSA